MPPYLALRIPARVVGLWVEVSFSIKARLSEMQKIPMEEISQAQIAEEVVKIAHHHIHIQGYPVPGTTQRNDAMSTARHREIVRLAERIDVLEAAIRVRESDNPSPDAGDK